MTHRADFVPTAVRTEPVQQRSTERIGSLLDAAADLIDANGIDGLTTSDVATRAGSSVGVVYRYFPNIQMLLRALAGRNLEKLRSRLFGSLRENAVDGNAALDALVDSYLELIRTEPGFRAVVFGGVIDRRFLHPESRNTALLAREFAEALVTNYGFVPSNELSLDVELVIEVIEALLHRAFLTDPEGDELVITRLREITRSQLAPHGPAHAR